MRQLLYLQSRETGIEELEETVKNMFFNGEVKFNEDVYITSTRHKELLKKAENSLKPCT